MAPSISWIMYALVGLFGYLLGSIPSGYLAARAKGIDIRKVGSGNIGATNAFRVLGKTVGITVLLADGLKGYFACRIPVWALAAIKVKGIDQAQNVESVMLLAGVCAILGHVFTIWLRFKGGKGIATTAGVGLAWIPIGLLIALGAWIVVTSITRIVSAGSLAAAVALPIGVVVAGGSSRMLYLILCISALAIYKHRGNIQRLIAGTEPKIVSKSASKGGEQP